MNKRNVGLFFVLVSLVLSSFNLLFTGAVVGAGSVSLSLVAVVFFVSGVVLIFVGATLEGRVLGEGAVSLSDVEEYVNRGARDGDVTLVVDSSFLISHYYGKEKDLLDFLKRFGDVVIPKEVLAEFSGRRQRGVKKTLEDGSRLPDDDYLKYMDKAREILGQGEKAYAYDIVYPILSGEEKEPQKGSEEHKEYSLAMNKLKWAVENRGDMSTNDNLMREADRHWAVSDADAAVLAVAMANGERGGEVVILERDKDIEEAVGYLGRIGGNSFSYVNSYKRVA